MTLSPWRTLQNVIQTQKCEPCQLNIPTTPFLAGGFPPDKASSTRPRKRKHGRSLTVMPWTTTDEFNVVPKTQRMSLASFPGHLVRSCVILCDLVWSCVIVCDLVWSHIHASSFQSRANSSNLTIFQPSMPPHRQLLQMPARMTSSMMTS